MKKDGVFLFRNILTHSRDVKVFVLHKLESIVLLNRQSINKEFRHPSKRDFLFQFKSAIS